MFASSNLPIKACSLTLISCSVEPLTVEIKLAGTGVAPCLTHIDTFAIGSLVQNSSPTT
ncbi:unnamed protein product [Brugia timori]|uniref:Uncharacterized protein n=1 Tax=Brugia timori TaxID=42155 RepID=A0A3P7UYG6_9BILA|nr:unnamed protein product [Brugia timori]